MRRILHIIDSLDYHGAASQLLVLAKGLAQQGRRRAGVCARSASAAVGRICGGRHSRRRSFRDAGRSIRWPIGSCMRHVRRLRPDVVHTWNTVPGMFGPIAAGRPFVAGALPRSTAGSWAGSGRSSAVLPCVARYVTNSNAVRAWCVHNGLPAEKFAVIPGGVEPARASDLSREALLRELNLPADARLIGVVGRLVPEKRVKDLIWAADLLRVLHDNLRMLIIGDGPAAGAA